jgi:hypothetical protein
MKPALVPQIGSMIIVGPVVKMAEVVGADRRDFGKYHGSAIICITEFHCTEFI